ncbi:glycosyltransferase [Neolewinella antarctica]|uniref:Glycosyltransferase involved in cell wall biosynthesis n=1 Tax=Neolewinella antarctica TaxID=442734 RepID=A0ABX0XDV9_9BACT|nr:glycosyltransferase [Neolewinella antarctica]NJC27111.1 glycosyltransferase involved in cell wall biosynthesis [Neolewinella antarctica]
MLTILFTLTAAIQLLFWGSCFRTAYRERWRTPPVVATHPASVIVCFRNEVDNLAACVRGILAQEYPPGFELILVDDNSTDGSTELARTLERGDDRVRVLYPGRTRPGKKDALAYGIAQAKHERLVLTDADCIPASRWWLWGIAGRLYGKTELLLGVSPYRAEIGAGLLARWQQFESVYVSLKYLSFSHRGLPYMGVGRNLAYTKSFFNRAEGFAGHTDLASGDDDLLVSSAATVVGTAVVVEPETWTYSAPQPNWEKYFLQRARHQSTGGRYPLEVSVLLTVLAASHGFFYVLGALMLWYGEVQLVAYCYCIRLLAITYACAPAYYPEALLGEDVDAGLGWKIWGKLLANVAFFDVWVGPMYLYLAVVGLVGKKSW